LPLIQRAAFLVSLILLATAIAGLLHHRLYRLCYSFPVWLLAVWASDGLMFAWPQRFYTWTFWLAKETVLAVLKVAIALEIIALAYQAFPQARAAARRLTFFLLVAVLLLLLVEVPWGGYFPTLAVELQRRVANGTALIFCGVWGLVLYYRLPLHALHRAILTGLAAYLVVFTVTNTVPLQLGWGTRQAVNVADAFAWAAVVSYWTWVAWRPQPVPSAFIRTLQPWRARA
jgi:hypothetical protein